MIRQSLAAFILFSGASFAADVIPGVGPTGEIKQVQTGFEFTEGPAADGHGNLYFTDIPKNRIHKLDSAGTLSVFVEPSGHCNGLMIVGDRLLACEMDGRLKAQAKWYYQKPPKQNLLYFLYLYRPLNTQIANIENGKPHYQQDDQQFCKAIKVAWEIYRKPFYPFCKLSVVPQASGIAPIIIREKQKVRHH